MGEARGDRMCQEALQDLKMAIRAAGEHKQRITIHVTIDGLRLRDEKTGDSLYHHPVHKISFIAQDMTDSRAFGYIFGSPDSGHRFFGIKTDKAASQVVLAMRDLFQVVFELKKKEIEMARQQIQGKSLHDHSSQLASLSSLKSSGLGGMGLGHSDLASGGISSGHALTLLGSSLSTTNGTSRLGVSLDVAKASGSAAKEVRYPVICYFKVFFITTLYFIGLSGIRGRSCGLGAGAYLASAGNQSDGTDNAKRADHQ